MFNVIDFKLANYTALVKKISALSHTVEQTGAQPDTAILVSDKSGPEESTRPQPDNADPAPASSSNKTGMLNWSCNHDKLEMCP